MICTKFDWNWLAGSGEEDCFQCKHMYIWFFLLWPLLIPGDHDLNKLEFTLHVYQKAFM
jgi:hypothetical protein